MPRLLIEREPSHYLGSFKRITIEINGSDHAVLGPNDRMDTLIEPGLYSIRARSGRSASPPLQLTVKDLETVSLSCSVSNLLQDQVSLSKRFHRLPEERFARAQSIGSNGKQSPSPYDALLHEQAGAASNGPERDWTRVLGTAPGSSLSRIRSEYIRLMQRYHPDKVINLPREEKAQAERKAREITAAYSEAMRSFKKKSP